jgi:NADP-dependent 3-hydroxy acid dehydrogenase YdfG
MCQSAWAYKFCAGNTLHYRQIDVRDVQGLNAVVKSISDAQGRLDGLIAAAGIQQETSALDYTQADANMMFEVNVTGKWAWPKILQFGGADWVS